jgi:hypothetical protein
MKLCVLPALAVLFIVSGNNRVAGQDDDLEAEWRLTSTHDEKQTYPGCDESRMIVRPGGRVVFELAGKVTSRGDCFCPGSGKLHCINLHIAEGKTLLGVYEVKGDELIICFAEVGQERPTATTPKGTQWVETWKRVKP